MKFRLKLIVLLSVKWGDKLLTDHGDDHSVALDAPDDLGDVVEDLVGVVGDLASLGGLGLGGFAAENLRSDAISEISKLLYLGRRNLSSLGRRKFSSRRNLKALTSLVAGLPRKLVRRAK